MFKIIRLLMMFFNYCSNHQLALQSSTNILISLSVSYDNTPMAFWQSSVILELLYFLAICLNDLPAINLTLGTGLVRDLDIVAIIWDNSTSLLDKAIAYIYTQKYLQRIDRRDFKIICILLLKKIR